MLTGGMDNTLGLNMSWPPRDIRESPLTIWELFTFNHNQQLSARMEIGVMQGPCHLYAGKEVLRG